MPHATRLHFDIGPGSRLSVIVAGLMLLAGCESADESRRARSETGPSVTAAAHDDGDLLEKIDRSSGACILFLGTDCPISNAYAPEIARIVAEYEPRGVRFYAAYVVRGLERDEAQQHARDFGYHFTLLLDDKLQLARRLGATHMPEAVLLPPQGEAIYQGRIDDRYPAPGGKRREHPSTRDLRLALDAFLAGEAVANPRTQSVGCPLDFLD